jgi:N-acetylglutamate synthase-like GNAT family acetyltransferase
MMFQLRLATLEDVPELQRLIQRSARGLSGGYYSATQIESAIAHVFGTDTRLIEDGTYFAAVGAGRIVGCGGWSRRRTLYGGDQMPRVDDSFLDPALEPARIRAFFVDPEWARRGIVREILGACTAAARVMNFTALELMATLPGVPLYEAEGFAALERTEAVLADGVVLPLMRMRRSIQLEGTT